MRVSLKDFRKNRARLQAYTWMGLPLVVVGGWFYPLLGFFLLGCMIAGLAIARFKGRAWCDWMCPRGSFYDIILQKISAKKTIPEFFRKKGVRVFMLAMLMGVLGTQIYFAWPDANKVGLAFVRLLTITTTVGIILGMIYQQRLWCHICPVGTLSSYMAEGKKPLSIDADMCGDCRLCTKVCPMQLDPHGYKAHGTMADNDCIKCSTCVAACPKKALEFQRKTA